MIKYHRAADGLEALLNAASIRLRPILLTSFTTIFALLPVAIGITAGTSLFQPFAITVIGGLVSGAFATLIIVPTLTILFFKGKENIRPEEMEKGAI